MTRLNQFSHGELRPGFFGLAADIPQSVIKNLCSRLGFHYFLINGEEISTKASFLSTFARTLQFPAYFGNNWDAFNDSVTDLSWLKGSISGLVILWQGFQKFADLSQADFGIATDCLNSAVDVWWSRKIPMYVLFQDVGGFSTSGLLVPEIQRPWNMEKLLASS